MARGREGRGGMVESVSTNREQLLCAGVPRRQANSTVRTPPRVQPTRGKMHSGYSSCATRSWGNWPNVARRLRPRPDSLQSCMAQSALVDYRKRQVPREQIQRN